MRSTGTLTKAAAPATTIAPTLGKAAPATILYPDFGDRIRALTNCATIAALGSPQHWRRLQRLDPATKRLLWDSLTPELKARLRAASLDYPPARR